MLLNRAFFYTLLTLFVSLSLSSQLLADTAVAPSSKAYLHELQQKAVALGLQDSPTWGKLLHYRILFGLYGPISDADDGDFFLSPEGKTDREAELLATLTAFFQTMDGVSKTAPHPQCRFVARYHWLKSKLHFDSSLLPEVFCEDYQEWRTVLDPWKITLVFPAAFMNNPASMFGHTLLRIDFGGQTEKNELLAYAANYSARTGGEPGLIYALMGLLGGYQGFFSVSPYYERVKKYSDLEHRDIWEYELKFSAEERELIVQHLWELRSVAFDYYYFDENCSYHLLSLLEVARPELGLTDTFHLWTIPVDTVRVLSEAGLIGEVTFRPADATKLRAHIEELSPEEKTYTRCIIDETLSVDALSIPKDSERKVLEASYEYLTYLKASRKTENEYRDLSYQLLRRRSELKGESPFLFLKEPKIRPEQGHRTMRARIGFGYDEDAIYHRYGFRPAYHDLLDPVEGYLPGAEIQFLDFLLQQREGDRLRLEELRIIDAASLTPREDFFAPLSWRLRLGGERERVAFEDDDFVYEAQGNIGFTWGLLPELQTSFLAGAAIEYATQAEKDWSLGVGGTSETYYRVSDWNSTRAKFTVLRYGVGAEHSDWNLGVTSAFHLSKEVSLRFTLERRREFTEYFTRVGSALHWYL